MGTRHLIAVQLNGSYKIAQYGQWDGHPSGQGTEILEFISDPAKLSLLKESAAKCTFLSTEEMEAISKDRNWPQTHPYLSRDAGAKVMEMVTEAGGLALKNSLPFAGDSVFCEFAYVVDFDKNTFDVLKGFNKSPLAKGERFHGVEGLEKSDGHYPVCLLKSFPLDALPTEEDFLKACEPNEEE